MSFFTSNWWLTYLIFFAVFAKSLWFIYYFSMYYYPRKKYEGNYTGKTTLIMPVYNEEPNKVEDTIRNAMKARRIDDMIVINDGSSDQRVHQVISSLSNEYRLAGNPFKYLSLEKNVGKRRAQAEGIKLASKSSDVFIFIDSDTILLEDSIERLLVPLADQEVAGATACILVRNKEENFVTKIISAMYWSASKIWREAPSRYGFVQVTNGQLSCYRAKYILELLPRYINQHFMGVNCTLSDDRWITHHLQTEFNKKIIYVDDCEVYTYVPTSILSAYKMFLRWKRGAWRESLLILKHSFKQPLLVADIWANHLVQIMQTFVRIGVIFITLTMDPFVILYYFLIVSIISTLYGFHMIVKDIKQLPYRISFSILNEVIFAWAYLHALITIHKQGKWGTR